MPTLNINNLDATQEIGWGSGFRMGKDNVYRGHGTAGSIPQLAKWFAGGIDGKKIVFVGDSTSDGSGNASGLYTELARFQTAKGSPLNGPSLSGVTIVSRGANGQTAAGYLTSNLPTAIADAADLYVVSLLINDVRGGACDLATAKTRLRAIVEGLRAGVPDACIILRMPNPLKIVDDGFVTPYTSATDYSYIIRDAYLSFADEWDDVLLWDTWRDLFGWPGSTSADNLLGDALHPANYTMIARAIVALVGDVGLDPLPATPASISAAESSVAANYAAPWSLYPYALDLLSRYELVAEGRFGAQGSGYFDVLLDRGQRRQFNLDRVIVWADGAAPFLSTANGGLVSHPQVRFSMTAPVTMTAGARVRIYIDRSEGDATLADYLDRTPDKYPFAIPIATNGGSGYIDIFSRATESNELLSQIQATDILVVAGVGDLTLTGFSFTAHAAGTCRCLKSGTYSSYASKRGWLFGTTHRKAPLLSGTPTNVRSGQLWYDSTTARMRSRSATTNFLLESQHLTETQRLAIASPYVGQIVYQTDATEGYYVYKSGGWAAL